MCTCVHHSPHPPFPLPLSFCSMREVHVCHMDHLPLPWQSIHLGKCPQCDGNTVPQDVGNLAIGDKGSYYPCSVKTCSKTELLDLILA